MPWHRTFYARNIVHIVHVGRYVLFFIDYLSKYMHMHIIYIYLFSLNRNVICSQLNVTLILCR